MVVEERRLKIRKYRRKNKTKNLMEVYEGRE